MYKEDASSMAFYEQHKDLWENTVPLKTFLGRASEFDAIFYPGGHGPMFDLVTDKDSIALINEFWDAGKIVSAVCHGPIAFANVKDKNGEFRLKGKKATVFTDEEEGMAQMAKLMPFQPETKLRETGCEFVKGSEAWASNVVVDGKLITGQNPNSAQGVGEALAKALGI